MKLVEVSSEAGHKVGGIYTVLRSKAGELVRRFGDDYILIGFYEPHSAKVEVKPEDPGEFKGIFKSLGKMGIDCYYGRWIEGDNARIILIDAYDFMNKVDGDKRINKIKYELWRDFGIDSLWAPYDFDLNVGWGWAAGMLIERLRKLWKEKMVVQFHEWMSGAALLYLKKRKVDVKSVFTTHATTLGRTLSSLDEDFMRKVFEAISKGVRVDDRVAYKHKLESKHLMEKACAVNADVFTTVSEITAKECEYILGKKPDKITPNGVDLSDFPSKDEEERARKRDELNKFIYAYFSPYYVVSPEKARILYISGRYEFRNKGIDIFINALGKLNKSLDREVFAFLFIPTSVRGPREKVMENVLMMDNLWDELNVFLEKRRDELILKSMERVKREEEFMREYKFQLLKQILDGSILNSDLIRFDEVKEMHELARNLKRENTLPPLCTYELSYQDDLILNELKKAGLRNREEDKVKVIFYPTYVKPGDGLINMEYY
ncbi:MAG TPA: hypothetical protein ENF51_02005, partial [Candidatus Aenigmarchaeota archaeon]|nr:hypothetical protein [Candidatus Aenigmarchaeota archaeon]